MTPKLKRVLRLDSIPLKQTYFTPEGYLIDRPIVTSVGIFEYSNPDGSIRHELRLPEEVFAEESLASYQGKPVIITHDAGYVSKDNVQEETIGTILSKGYRDGDDVRAEIVIHNTDAMKDCGLRELSLGYSLDIEETPGEWNGQRYDAIQRNIRINHLALVGEARAGEQARLNIDGRDKQILKGGKCMKSGKTRTKRRDGVLSDEELEKAVAEYKKRRENRLAAKADEDEPEPKAVPNAVPTKGTAPGAPKGDEDEPLAGTPDPNAEPAKKIDEGEPITAENAEEAAAVVKDRRDRRDEMGDPENLKEANGIIAQQDEDIDYLFDIIDTLLAKMEFTQTAQGDADEGTQPAGTPIIKENETDEEDTFPGNKPVPAEDGDDICGENEDEDEPLPGTAPQPDLNKDSADSIARQWIKIGKIGNMLNLDGLEDMSITRAKKAIIKAVSPDMRLDGKSRTYIDAAFDCAAAEVRKRATKDTSYQKRQMFNKDGYGRTDSNSSRSARERMIERRQNTNKEGK